MLRGAAIEVLPPPARAISGGDWNYAAEEPRIGFDVNSQLPSRIITAVSLMRGLRYLNLCLSNLHKEQLLVMKTRLNSAEPWDGVKLLRLKAPSVLAVPILQRQVPNLEGLDLDSDAKSRQFSAVVKHHAGLKRLHIKLGRADQHPGGFGAACVEVGQTVRKAFPSLKWLGIFANCHNSFIVHPISSTELIVRICHLPSVAVPPPLCFSLSISSRKDSCLSRIWV